MYTKFGTFDFFKRNSESANKYVNYQRNFVNITNESIIYIISTNIRLYMEMRVLTKHTQNM